MRLFERLSPRRLQFRIVALFLGLLLLVQVATLFLIGSRIEENARTAVGTELRTGERMFARLLQHRADHLSEAARRLAADDGFLAAIDSGDPAFLRSTLEVQGQRAGASVVLFVDTRFGLRAATAGADRFLDTLRDMGTLPVGAQRLALVDGLPYQLVMVPAGAPAASGWLALGARIRSPLLREMRELSSIEVALLTRSDATSPWRVAQSTLDGDASAPWLGGAWSAVPGSAAAPGRSDRLLDFPDDTTATLHGAVLARELPLGHDGRQQLVAVLMRSIDEAAAPYRRLEWLLVGFAAVALGVFAVGSIVTARRITTPLLALTASVRKLAQGDYEEPLLVKGRDEIGELARTFEAMRQAVRTRDAEVRRLAYEDGLTRLPNRERFRVDLREAISRASSTGGEPCAVLMLDLDRFKHVNDVLGHRFGDRLLCEVARRLTREGRGPRDMVARLGGDEFALLLPGAGADTALGAARAILRGLELPITLDEHTVDLSAGIGIACCPHNGLEAELLMMHAEIAMYAAKRRQSGVVLYDTALDTGSRESLSLMSELRTAVEQQQLRLWLQPKVSLATGQVVGAEALMRWQHPVRGLIPPLEFIPFAEQTGFIRRLTAWMLESGAALTQQLHAAGVPIDLSINLSTRDLLDADLPGKLQQLAELHRLVPASLCLEITESAIMDEPQRALQTLERLHRQGFRLSIDDFGTGYSSLAYLKRLPVDELKIDKSFVLNMEHDLHDAKIVRSVVDLAHNLGLSVVAEGVETAKAWKMLEALGCDQVQGYLIARPMPQELFLDWLAAWTAPQTQAVRLDTAFAALT